MNNQQQKETPDSIPQGNYITCTVCPHSCKLVEGELGLCGVRTQQEGRNVSLNYGQATGLSLDPIEKKPLARFHNGSYILSYGSFGCNMRCEFCQNSDISMRTAHQINTIHQITAEEFVEQAIQLKDQGNIGVAFTYNEPLIAPEFLIDVAKLAHEADLFTIAITNGYTTKKTRDDTFGLIDAFNIDLKCYSEEGYHTLGAPGGLRIVKRSIEAALEAGAHVEVTTLITPGLSDDEELFRKECDWLASVDATIPLHITRFFPSYHAMDQAPTDKNLLERFSGIAREVLDYVYVGNI